MRKQKIVLFAILLLTILSQSLFAQKTVKGVVIDDKGQPLSSVNVTLKPLNSANVLAFGFSKNDGSFSLKIANEADSLVIGLAKLNFTNQNLVISNADQSLNFTLRPGAQELREVIETSGGAAVGRYAFV